MAEQRGHPQGHVRTWQRQMAHLAGAMTSTERSQDKESEDSNAKSGCVSSWPGAAPAISGVSVFLSEKWRHWAARPLRSLPL